MVGGRFQVQKLRDRLDQAFGRYAKIAGDEELQSDYSRYLCVLTSGYVEQAVWILLREFSRRGANPRVFRYAETNLGRFQNPTTDNIAGLLGAFDAAWRTDFEAFVADERKDALNSLVATRHQIAHGESVGITFLRLKAFRMHIDTIIEWLVDLTDPSPRISA